MNRQVQQVLDQLTGEGQLDSAGSFSIDYSRALDKVSKRLFQEPDAYPVQWHQAAYLLGAGEVRLRATKQQLEYQFSSPQLSPDLVEELPQQLNQPLPSPGSALGHLLRGIHLARIQEGLQLAILYQDQEQGWLEPLNNKRQPLPASKSGPPQLTLIVCSSVPRSWASEKQLLSQRCALSPVPIYWNGKSINPCSPWLPSRASGLASLLERIYLSQQPSRDLLALPHATQVPAFCYDLGGGYQDRYSYGKSLLLQWRSPGSRAPYPLCAAPDFPLLESDLVQEVFGIPKEAYALNHGLIRPGRVTGSNNFYQILYVPNTQNYTRTAFDIPQGRFGKQPSLAAHCWMRCPTLPTRESALILQQHGVLLDPVPLHLEPALGGLQVYATLAQPIKTDLSGMAPLHDEQLGPLQHWVQDEVVKARKELRKALRWNDKYGLSDAQSEEIHRLHSLDRGE